MINILKKNQLEITRSREEQWHTTCPRRKSRAASGGRAEAKRFESNRGYRLNKEVQNALHHTLQPRVHTFRNRTVRKECLGKERLVEHPARCGGEGGACEPTQALLLEPGHPESEHRRGRGITLAREHGSITLRREHGIALVLHFCLLLT